VDERDWLAERFEENRVSSTLSGCERPS
jgi:hypothetical protein